MGTKGLNLRNQPLLLTIVPLPSLAEMLNFLSSKRLCGFREKVALLKCFDVILSKAKNITFFGR